MKYETFGAFLLAVAMPIMAAPTQPEPANAAVEDAVRAIIQQQQQEQPKVEARMVINPGIGPALWRPRYGLPVRPFPWTGPKYMLANSQPVAGANIKPAVARRDIGDDLAAGEDDEAHLERRKFGRKTNAINAIANLAGSVLPWLNQRDLDGLAVAGDDEAHLERRKFGRKTNAVNAIANLAGQVLPWLGLGQRDLSGVEGAGLEAREEPILTEAEVRDTIASVFDQYEQANQKRDVDGGLERRKFGRKTNAVNAIANLAGQVLPWLGLGQRDLSGVEGAGLEAREEPILSEAEVRDTIASVIDQYEQQQGGAQKRDLDSLERRKFGRKTNAVNAIANLAGQVLPWLGLGQRDLSGIEARDAPILTDAEIRDTIASVVDQYEQQQAGGAQKRDLDSLERRKFGRKTNAVNAIANLAGQVLPWLGLGQRDLSGIEARDAPILTDAEIRDTIASVVDQYEAAQQ